MSLEMALRRTTNTMRSGPITNHIYPQWRYLLKRATFLLGPWTLLVQLTNKRETNIGLKLSNKSKTTYTPCVAIMLDCVSWELENQGVPMVIFVHHKPIRRRHLRSHDLHAGFTQSDARASQWQ